MKTGIRTKDNFTSSHNDLKHVLKKKEGSVNIEQNVKVIISTKTITFHFRKFFNHLKWFSFIKCHVTGNCIHHPCLLPHFATRRKSLRFVLTHNQVCFDSPLPLCKSTLHLPESCGLVISFLSLVSYIRIFTIHFCHVICFFLNCKKEFAISNSVSSDWKSGHMVSSLCKWAEILLKN